MNNMNHRNAVHNINSSAQPQYTGSDIEQTDERDYEDQNTAQSKVNFIAKQYIR